MNVNCLSCGHLLDLHEAYDDYQGQIRCCICGALLTLHTEGGQVKSSGLAQLPREPATVPPGRAH
jgi:hypothetical protein